MERIKHVYIAGNIKFKVLPKIVTFLFCKIWSLSEVYEYNCNDIVTIYLYKRSVYKTFRNRNNYLKFSFDHKRNLDFLTLLNLILFSMKGLPTIITGMVRYINLSSFIIQSLDIFLSSWLRVYHTWKLLF